MLANSTACLEALSITFPETVVCEEAPTTENKQIITNRQDLIPEKIFANLSSNSVASL
jgi:hypothetical protein